MVVGDGGGNKGDGTKYAVIEGDLEKVGKVGW